MQGRFVVLYYSTATILQNPLFMLYGAKTLNDLKAHTEVYSGDVAGEHATREEWLEQLFRSFNDYDTNPMSAKNDPQKQEWLKQHQLHTSMSVGDAVRIELADGTKETWAVKGRGWEKLVN
jgi:hypothetical protein